MAPGDFAELRKEDVENLLHQLGSRLAARGLHADIYVVGGAAMVIGYNSERATGDIDAILLPADVVLEEAHQMAEAQGLPDDWLNDNVKVTMPQLPDSAPRKVLDFPGVRVEVASPEYLLGMKATTSRMSQRDKADASLLCRILGITDADALMDTVYRSTGTPVQLEPRRWFFEEIVNDAMNLTPQFPVDVPGASRSAAGGCPHWMPRARRRCQLAAGHRGQHR